MFPIILIVLVILIILALFLVESEIGIYGIIKSLIIITIAILSGGGIYYCIRKINEPNSSGIFIPDDRIIETKKWGGLGLSTLCNTEKADDDTFLKIATDQDIDVRAFNKGCEVYADLKNDTSGDSQLAYRSQFQAGKNKNAVINRSRLTADSVRKYFEDELQSNENKVWWENDDLDAFT
jgi:hypothetical protein